MLDRAFAVIFPYFSLSLWLFLFGLYFFFLVVIIVSILFVCFSVSFAQVVTTLLFFYYCNGSASTSTLTEYSFLLILLFFFSHAEPSNTNEPSQAHTFIPRTQLKFNCLARKKAHTHTHLATYRTNRNNPKGMKEKNYTHKILSSFFFRVILFFFFLCLSRFFFASFC